MVVLILVTSAMAALLGGFVPGASDFILKLGIGAGVGLGVCVALIYLTCRWARTGSLKPWLVGSTDALSIREAGEALEMTEGAVKTAIHRLRKKFRELIRTELGQTVNTPAEVEEELRYLVEVLS